MGRRYERQEILERLQATIVRGQPVLGSGAGCGLVAKCVELGGVDLIFALALATTRMKGLPSPILPDNNNQLILGMFEELSVERTRPLSLLVSRLPNPLLTQICKPS